MSGYRDPVDLPSDAPVTVRAQERGNFYLALAGAAHVIALTLALGMRQAPRFALMLVLASAAITTLVLRAVAKREQLVILDPVRDTLRHVRTYVLREDEAGITMQLTAIKSAAIASSDEAAESDVRIETYDGALILCTARHDACVHIVAALERAVHRARELHREATRRPHFPPPRTLRVHNAFFWVGQLIALGMLGGALFGIALWRGVTLECKRAGERVTCVADEAVFYGTEHIPFTATPGAVTCNESDSGEDIHHRITVGVSSWRSLPLREASCKAAVEAYRRFIADPNAKSLSVAAHGAPWLAMGGIAVWITCTILFGKASEMHYTVVIDESIDELRVERRHMLKPPLVTRHMLTGVKAVSVDSIEDSDFYQVLLDGTQVLRGTHGRCKAVEEAIRPAIAAAHKRAAAARKYVDPVAIERAERAAKNPPPEAPKKRDKREKRGKRRK